MTSSLVHGMSDGPTRTAFEAWWATHGYTPPDDTDDKDAWDAYHVRYGGLFRRLAGQGGEQAA